MSEDGSPEAGASAALAAHGRVARPVEGEVSDPVEKGTGMNALRKGTALVGLTVVLGALVVGLPGRVAASPQAPFVGTWWAIDPSDGSLEQVTFGADGSLFFRDDVATTCGGVQAVLNDVGTVSGNTWTGSGTATLRCPSVGQTRGPVYFQFTLNADGTLSGVGPEVWTRARPAKN